MNLNMQHRFVLMLGLLLLLCFTQANAQNSSVASYAGTYYSTAHPSAALSILATADGFRMDFCKDIIMNDCKQVTIQKSLSNTQEFQIATADHGSSAPTFTATVTQTGANPTIQVKLQDGKIWEFQRR
jgi:hypothetical protein